MKQEHSPSPTTFARKMRYRLLGGAILLALGLALFAVPNQFEGPSLLHRGPGRGVSVSDVVALAVLAVGVAFILGVLWHHRPLLAKQLNALRAVGGVEIFCAGLGAGLIIARVLATLQWGWLLTWAAVASPLLIAILIVRRQG